MFSRSQEFSLEEIELEYNLVMKKITFCMYSIHKIFKKLSNIFNINR